jgi:hypothetical protein
MKGKGSRLAILLALVLTLVGAFGVTALAADTDAGAEDVTKTEGYYWKHDKEIKDEVNAKISETSSGFNVDYEATQLRYVKTNADGITRPQLAAWVGVKMIAPNTVVDGNKDNAKIEYTYLYTVKADEVKNYSGAQFFDGKVSDEDSRYYGTLWIHVSEADVRDSLSKTSNKGIIKADVKCDWNGDSTYDTIYNINIDVNNLKLLTAGTAATILKTVDGKVVHTVSFDSNGGTGDAMADLDVPEDEATSLTANTYKNTGHLFDGWAESETGDKKYADRGSVKFTATDPAEITLYAKWAEHKHVWKSQRNAETNDDEFWCENESCEYSTHQTAGIRATDKTYDGSAAEIAQEVSEESLIRVDTANAEYFNGKSRSDADKLSAAPTDAGEYTVRAWYYVKVDGVEKKFGTVWDYYTISPAQLKVTAKAETNLTYNGDEQTLLKDAGVSPEEMGSFVSSVTDKDATEPGAFSGGAPSAKDVGTYKVWYKAVPDTTVEGSSNYAESEVSSVEVTIAEKEVAIGWTNSNGEAITTSSTDPYTGYNYNGKNQSIKAVITSGLNEKDASKVAVDYDDTEGSDSNVQKDHKVDGNYVTKVKATLKNTTEEDVAKNYKVAESAPAYWNINQVPLTIKVGSGSVVYGASVDDAKGAVSNNLTYEGFAEGDSADNVIFTPTKDEFKYSLKKDDVEYQVGSDVGTYTATITSAITAQNYAPITVTAGKLEVTKKTLGFEWKDEEGNPAVDPVEYTYDGNKHRVIVSIDPTTILEQDIGKVTVSKVSDKRAAVNHRVKDNEADFTPAVTKLGGEKAGNYTFISAGEEGSTAQMTWRINRADLTLTPIQPDRIKYGEAAPEIKLNYVGLKNGNPESGEEYNTDVDPDDQTQPNPNAKPKVLSKAPEVSVVVEGSDTPYTPGSDVSSDSNKYVVKVDTTGITSTNYNIKVSETPVYLTVDPRKIAFDWYLDNQKVESGIPSVEYDGNNHEVTATVQADADSDAGTDGIYNGDELTVVLKGETAERNYKRNGYKAKIDEVTGEKAHNYTFDEDELLWKITKKPLTIKANNNSVQFGDEGEDNYVTYTTLVDSDKNSEGEPKNGVFEGKLAYDFRYTEPDTREYKAGDDAGAYIIRVRGVTANNYDITFEDGALTVEKRQVSFKWTEPNSFVYDGKQHEVTVESANNDYAAKSVLNGLTITNNSEKNADSYEAVATLSEDAQKNYVVKGDTDKYAWDITPATVTVTADNKTVSYGDPVPKLTSKTSGVPAKGDEVKATLTTDYFQNAKAGAYTIKVTAGDNPNYNVKVVNGTLTVNDKVTTLVAQGKASGKKAVVVSWNGVTGAASYDVYLAKCNTKKKTYSPVYKGTTSGNSFKVKKLKKGTCYKYFVVAKNASGAAIAQSEVGHFIAGNVKGKKTNAKSITASTNVVSLNKGGSYALTTSQAKAKGGKKYKLLNGGHAPLTRYISSNPAVATVGYDNGVITGVGGGYCKVYAIAVNGMWSEVEVYVN